MRAIAILLLSAAPALAGPAEHARCVSIVSDAYEAADTIMAGRMAANDLVAGSPDQRTIIDTGSKAADAVQAYIDALSDACEAMR